MQELEITNPKRNGNATSGRESWYSFYAGYSSGFAYSLLRSLEMDSEAAILDPWNGIGTTTTAAAALGLSASGFDLNPAMALISKAMLVSPYASRQVLSAAEANLRRNARTSAALPDDPLLVWFSPRGVSQIRALEKGLLGRFTPMGVKAVNVDRLTRKQSFAYLLLFRVVRGLLGPFYASNPTWLKQPKDPRKRLRPGRDAIRRVLLKQTTAAIAAGDTFARRQMPAASDVRIRVASSTDLPLPDKSIDVVLTSPPYCTRIDYAVATSAELATLGYGSKSGFRELRQALLGTSTVPLIAGNRNPAWGETCNRFLDQVWAHNSKASRTYYYKNHACYYHGMHSSLAELARVLKPKGLLVIVVQDSFYKDVHNDLPRIVCEMAEVFGLHLIREDRFVSKTHMANKNPHSQRYRGKGIAIEAVLCFARAGSVL